LLRHPDSSRPYPTLYQRAPATIKYRSRNISIDYLTRPEEVLREVGRVLKVGSPLIVTFSNRCFPDKAVALWLQLDDQGHMRLVEEYLREAGNFENIRSLDRSPRRLLSDPLYAVIGESTGACLSNESSL
jgi:ubiquinone/menaquinone biosynthesis C-methylase UbiE